MGDFVNICQACSGDRGKKEVFCRTCEENLSSELAEAMYLAQGLYKKGFISTDDYHRIFHSCLVYLKIKVNKIRSDGWPPHRVIKAYHRFDSQILFSLWFP